jgi:hypothetical protein
MTVTYAQRIEQERLRRLGQVRERLTARGLRTLLVRSLRLKLNRDVYGTPVPGVPVLVAWPAEISVEDGFHVRTLDGDPADFVSRDRADSTDGEQVDLAGGYWADITGGDRVDFADADEVADYVAARVKPAS